MITHIFSSDNNTAKTIYSSICTFIHDKKWTENNSPRIDYNITTDEPAHVVANICGIDVELRNVGAGVVSFTQSVDFDNSNWRKTNQGKIQHDLMLLLKNLAEANEFNLVGNCKAENPTAFIYVKDYDRLY